MIFFIKLAKKKLPKVLWKHKRITYSQSNPKQKKQQYLEVGHNEYTLHK